jgi:hypothetical protein
VACAHSASGRREAPRDLGLAGVQHRGPSEQQIKGWINLFPDGGIGHAAGHDILFVDLDFTDQDKADGALQTSLDHLGYTPLIRTGKPPKQVRVYRLPPDHGITSRKWSGLDLFAATGQVVLLAIHPQTGKPYQWPDASPLEAGPDDAPIVTPESVGSFVQAMGELIPARANKPPSLTGSGEVADFLRIFSDNPDRNSIGLACELMASADEGGRHSTMLGLVGALIMRGHPDAAVSDALRSVYLCKFPPAEQRAREADFDRAIKWMRQRHGVDNETASTGVNATAWNRWGV